MKLILLQENLAKGISILSRIISSKAQLPILANVLLKTEEGRLKLSATNLETGINLWIGAKIEKEGSYTLPAKVLSEFINSLPKDKVEIELKGNLLKISCLSYSASLNGLPPNEFPPIPSFSGKTNLDLLPEVFSQAVNQVAFSAATDEGRPVLTGILVIAKTKNLKLVATDGYRLSVKKLTDPTIKELNKEIIIPARTMTEVGRVISEAENKEKEKICLELMKEGNQIIFHYQDVDLVTRLIEGQFPAYEKIIPTEHSTRIIVSVEDLMKAVKVASIFARESANIIKLKVQNNQLRISANAPQVGENETVLEVKQEGEDNKIAFNSRYLLDLLNNIGSEELVFEMSGSLNPGVFKPVGDDNYLHIIMPVRVQEE